VLARIETTSKNEDRIRILIADDPRPYSKVTWQPNGQGQKVRRRPRP
jgi:hypothetical protein